MNKICTDRKDATIDRIVRATFPGYTGRTITIEAAESVNCASYWDGGSRSYFRFLDLATFTTSGQMPAQSAFDPHVRGLDRVPLAPNLAIVEHSIVCGKDAGITIHVHALTLVGLLPAPVTLSWADSVVLTYTRSLKPCYAGISNYRYHEAHRETTITAAEWDAAKADLIRRGLLNKAGAITDAGRNAIGWKARYELKRPAPVEA